jgi:hypothetical protein
LAVDPAGRYAYLPEGRALERFSISSDGTLESLAVQVMPDTPQVIASAADTRNALVLGLSVGGDGYDGEIIPFSIGTDGTFTQLQSPSRLGVDAVPAAVAISQSGSGA